MSDQLAQRLRDRADDLELEWGRKDVSDAALMREAAAALDRLEPPEKVDGDRTSR